MVITRSSKRRGETSYSSVSTTPHLPIDLISDILSRLPVKPLIRFKSVSKPWYSLISSPNFIHNHQRHSKINPNPIFSAVLSVPQSRNTNKYVFRLNLIDALDKPVDIEFPFMSERCFRVLGICDGLVCVLLRDESSDIIVCNPAIGKFRKIPPFDDSPWYNDCIFFGFGSSENGYELFRIDYESVRIKANSFSLGTNTWRDIRAKMGKFETYSDPTAFVEPLRCFEAVPILRNGVFYWEGHDAEDGRVLSFDVFNEVLDEIWAPDDTFDADWELRELKDELALVIYHSRRVFDVWVLNENEKTWMLKESIDVNDSLTEFPGDNRVKVLGCAGTGDLVLEDHDDNNSKLYLYDMDTDDVDILPYVNADGNHEVYLYTESLVSVDTSNDVVEADPHLA